MMSLSAERGGVLVLDFDSFVDLEDRLIIVRLPNFDRGRISQGLWYELKPSVTLSRP